ncbi:hypothetical protein DXG01_006153 [Tephrocybe rancida]|nr:hypothetical protein DXG01_006153 [Tephrocybe rancida]
MPFKVNVNRVTFHHDVQMYLPVAPKPDVYWKPVEENKYPLYNHNYVYLGWRVMVIRRGVFKGYQGIIREILVDDEVRVELSPTLKREVFHLSQLANLNDNKRQPLMYKFQPHTFTAGMPPPAQPVEIPQSLMPLTPSTPLLAGSSSDIGPAWNPSLRMPDSRLQFHKWIVTASCATPDLILIACNPYMDHWRIDLTRKVKVCIHNTKPILHDPGWKNGDYEGKKGLWKASDTMDPGFAQVQILVPPMIIRVPKMIFGVGAFT